MVISSTHSDRMIAYILAIIISASWAISFVVDIFKEGYDPPASVHALMMIVAGAVFGEGLVRGAVGTIGTKKGAKEPNGGP